MSDINIIYTQAHLALAAYGNFNPSTVPSTDELQRIGMTETQAVQFAQNWFVVDQYNDPNGLSVTVFENTSKRYLAIRGTDFSLLDLTADYILANGFPADLNFQFASLKRKVEEWTNNGVLPTVFTVAGHSLGGYLADAVGLEYGARVQTIYTYNAPGVDGGLNSVVDYLREALGITNPGTLNNLYNLRATSGYSLIANLGRQLAPPIFIETEFSLNPLVNHSVIPLTDSLGLYDLFARIDPLLNTTDPTVGIGKITDILKASSAQAASSLERTVDALVNFFGLDFAPLAGTQVGDREAMYQRLVSLRTIGSNLSANNPGVVVDVLANTAAVDLANLAQGSTAFAYRYALRQLNPFAIVGNNDIYAPHNANGELDLYNPLSRTGTLTIDWIKDRAKLLYADLIRNTQDIADPQVPVLLPGSGDRVTEYHHYRSGKEEVFFAQPAGSSTGQLPTEVVMFADDEGRLLTGTDNLLGDHLYGGANTDYLIGKANDDSLEGGKGLDIYQYNSSSGTSGPPNDGADVIQDIDGKGVLRYVFNDNGTLNSTVIADASQRVSGLQWNSADGRFSYTRSQDDLIITINGNAGGSITLKDFHEGDFYIHLWEARADPPITSPEILGDLQPEDFDPNTPGIQTQTDALGNVIVTTNSEPDRNDVLNDSTANDRIIAGGGNDVLRGIRGGDDWMSGETGRDNLAGGAGADLIEGGADGMFEGESGGDIAFGDVGGDELYADTKIALAQAITQGNSGAASNAKGEYLSGGGDDDWIVGVGGDDYLDGGSGQDLIVGGAGDDNITGDYGFVATTPLWVIAREIIPQDNSTLHRLNFLSGSVSGLDFGAGAADVVYAGSGADWVAAGDGDDFADGGSGDDKIWGEAGSDVLIGGADNDLLVGDNPTIITGAAEGADYLDGGAGDDQLEGDGGGDVLIGGTGNDTLNGDTGKDIYIFNRGDGTETVFDTDTDPNNPDASVLVLGDGVSQSAIKFKTGSLAVDIGPSDPADSNSPHDVIHFSGFNQIDPIASMPLAEIRFGDGTGMSYADILAQGFDIDGTEGDDTGVQNLVGTGVTDRIRGFGGNDLLFGFRGDDVLDGGDGVDQILGGPGVDIIYGGSEHDEIWGDAENGGIFAPDGNDVIYAGSGNDMVQGNGGGDQIFGDDESDTLYGDDGADVLDGGADNDFLYGQGYFFLDGIPFLNFFDDRASDTLRGGDGNDYLNAAAGNDVLEGGAGDDNLEAEAGADYITGGDGNDLLWGDKADSPLADQGNDTLDGGASADQLVGYAGNDTYIFGRGHGQDIIFDHDTTIGNIDRIEFAADVTPDDVAAVQSGANLVLTIGGTEDALTIANQLASTADRVEEIQFADGTVWDPNSIPFAIRGTAGNDILSGTTGADIFEGLAGNDTMSGTAGNDIYRIFRGDGQDVITDFDSTPDNVDTVSYGSDVLPSEIQAFRLGNNLALRLSGTADQVTVTNYFLNDGATPNSVERIRFLADGTSWNVDLIKQMVLTGTAAEDTITGYATNDVLSGLGGNDTLNGNAGDDSLDGGTGNDLLQGGTGNDVYLIARGSGQDTVTDIDATVGNVDKIVYTADILHSDVQAARSGNNLVLKLAGATDQVTVTNYFQNDGATTSLVEQMQFANGIWDLATIKSMVITPTSGDDAITGYATDDSLSGLAGNDTIRGAAGNDTLNGGAGNDTLFGEGGSDTYLFARGDGQDVIDNGASDGAGTIDVLSFAEDILPVDITPTREGRDLILSIQDAVDQVRIQNYFFSGQNVIEEIRFADGTLWTEQTILGFLPPPPVVGTESNDILQGTIASELIRGLGGDDTMRGAGGNDTFEGGVGEDWQFGLLGNDTYLFNLGDGGPEGFFSGGDVLSDSGGFDVLQLGPGISAIGGPNVTEFNDPGGFGHYIAVDIPNTPGGVYMLNYFSTGHIEEIRFDDGTVWTDQTIAPHVPIRDTSGINNLTGTIIADAMYGLDGNDTMHGGLGHDTLDGGLGSDSLFGDDGNDVLVGGTGESRKSLAYDMLRGGNGEDILIAGEKGSDLYGEDGEDILLGSANPDRLVEFAGTNLLAGWASSDFIDMGDHKDLVIGGTGNDVIDGDNSNLNGIYSQGVLAFNKTDGKDSVQRLGSGSTISIGGGTLYANLSLEVQGATLRLKTSNSNYVALDDWYASPANKSISTLQIVIEGTRDYNPSSANPINNRKIQTFDFLGLVDAFDAARAAGQTFKVANNLEAHHLSGSDTEAIGGAIAYQYALTGTLDALTYDQMRAVISDPALADSAQSISSPAGTALAAETTAPLADTFSAMAVAEELTTSKNEESRLSADTEVITDQQANTFALETESPRVEGDETTSPNTEMVSADGVVSRVPVEHVIVPTPVLPSLSSTAPGAQLANQGSQHSASGTPRSSEALNAKPTLPGLVTDDPPVASGSMGDHGEAVHAAHTGVSSADREASTGTKALIDEWFARHPWNDDLTLLDEITHGESGVGASGSNNASMAADWRRSHTWLNGRLHSSMVDSEEAGGVYLDSQSFLGDSSTLFDVPRATVGLHNVAGHSLKSFSGLREGMNILSQS